MCQALTKRKAKCKNRQEPYCYLHKLSMENKTLKESQKKLEKTVKTKNNKIKKIGYDWLNEMAKKSKRTQARDSRRRDNGIENIRKRTLFKILEIIMNIILKLFFYHYYK